MGSIYCVLVVILRYQQYQNTDFNVESFVVCVVVAIHECVQLGV